MVTVLAICWGIHWTNGLNCLKAKAVESGSLQYRALSGSYSCYVGGGPLLVSEEVAYLSGVLVAGSAVYQPACRLHPSQLRDVT